MGTGELGKEQYRSIISTYFLSFGSRDFSAVQFSSNIEFLSPISGNTMKGHDKVVKFVSGVASRVAKVNILSTTVNFPTAKRRMAGFVATEKQKHGERNEPCNRGPLPKDASRVERMKRKLKTKVGAAVYARRKCMVESVFGQIKQARGFRQFLLRGLHKVRGEWALICMTHNLLKFHKICYG
jgi:uncharacterized protein DUF4904/DDE family transposase